MGRGTGSEGRARPRATHEDAAPADGVGAGLGASALADPARLAALARTGILLGTPDAAFDRISELAAMVLGVPVALVSIVDDERQVFVGCVGLPEPWATARETRLSHSFCQHVVALGAPLVIADARTHPLVRDNAAIRDLDVIAYAGMPLVTADGVVLGSFCAIDVRPREWTASELAILRRIADSVVTEIELRTAERVATESTARLQAAMDAADMGAWSYDVATQVRWHSPRATELLGLGEGESLVPRTEWLAQIHADDRARVAACLDGSVQDGRRYVAEYRVRDAAGGTRWIASTGRLLRDAEGAAARVVGTLQDVTERVRMEAERREGAERLRHFVEAMPLFAWLNRADGSVEFFNQRWYAYTGQDATFLADGRWLDAIHPEDRPRVRAERDRGIAAGEPYGLEFRTRSTGGTYRWMDARVEPVRGADGSPIAWVGAALDVEERRRLELALRESETRFRTLQDVSPDGSALFTAMRDARGAVVDFRLAYANTAAARILTGRDEPLMGRTMREAFPESVAAGRLDVYRRIVETGEPWQHDVAYVRGDVRRGLRVNAVKVGDGVHLDFADLTERFAAAAERERLLAETAAAHGRLAAILEGISASFFALDAEWRISHVNSAAARYVGRTREELLGRTLWEAFPTIVGTELAERLGRAMRERCTEEYEYLSPVFARWLRVRVDATPDGGVSLIAEDVDARRRGETWRDEQRRVLERIATARPLDEILASVATLAESQLRGGRAAIVVHDAAAGAPERTPHAPAFEGLRAVWARPILAADDRVLGTFTVFGPTPDAPTAREERFLDEATHLAGIALERARSEAERERLLAAERTSRAEAEGARAVADTANRAKSDFLAMMSHELRTPLNAIGGYAELIELGVRGPVTPEQRVDLARLQKSQRHLLGLINGVLSYAKIDAGAVTYDVVDVPLDEALATCEALVAPQVRAKGLVLHHAGCAPDVRVRADREKVQQILLNLLSNALKFTAGGGRIAVTCDAATADGTVRIAVADTGEGIAPDKLERVFEPFVQVDTRLTRMQEGTGLGLAISRELARGMGGDLTAASAPGVGSTFTLTLPHA
jgi:PAS domain S-box-containing protein